MSNHRCTSKVVISNSSKGRFKECVGLSTFVLSFLPYLYSSFGVFRSSEFLLNKQFLKQPFIVKSWANLYERIRDHGDSVANPVFSRSNGLNHPEMSKDTISVILGWRLGILWESTSTPFRPEKIRLEVVTVWKSLLWFCLVTSGLCDWVASDG